MGEIPTLRSVTITVKSDTVERLVEYVRPDKLALLLRSPMPLGQFLLAVFNDDEEREPMCGCRARGDGGDDGEA